MDNMADKFGAELIEELFEKDDDIKDVKELTDKIYPMIHGKKTYVKATVISLLSVLYLKELAMTYEFEKKGIKMDFAINSLVKSIKQALDQDAVGFPNEKFVNSEH